MIGTGGLFGDLKGALKEWLGLAVVTTRPYKPKPGINAFARSRIVGAKNFLARLECLFKQRLGLWQIALIEVNRAEIVLDIRGVGIFSSERFSVDLQCALIHRFSLREVALMIIECGQVTQAIGNLRIIGAPGAPRAFSRRAHITAPP